VARAAVALGSNLGDRLEHLESAIEALRALGEVAAESPVYETAPIGGPRQGPYLNAVVLLDTELPADALLEELLRIERGLGRRRREPWGPRTIDLDLLLYGAESIDRPGLTVPHPRMTERRFVLAPLLDVWPDATMPDGTPVASFRDDVAGQEVERFIDESGFNPWKALAVFVIFNVAAAVIWRVIGWF
jgi:2-amino-4-hydroxy-6-hydroxymethyldihydropteridine diphosphokinase